MNRKARASFLKLRRAEGWSNQELITLEKKAVKLKRESYLFTWGSYASLDKPTDFWDDNLQKMWVGFEEAYNILRICKGTGEVEDGCSCAARSPFECCCGGWDDVDISTWDMGG